MSLISEQMKLPMELDAIGFWSPWALLWFCLFSVAP